MYSPAVQASGLRAQENRRQLPPVHGEEGAAHEGQAGEPLQRGEGARWGEERGERGEAREERGEGREERGEPTDSQQTDHTSSFQFFAFSLHRFSLPCSSLPCLPTAPFVVVYIVFCFILQYLTLPPQLIANRLFFSPSFSSSLPRLPLLCPARRSSSAGTRRSCARRSTWTSIEW